MGLSASEQKGNGLTLDGRSSAKSLEVESGITLEHTSIVAFRKAVLMGDWKNAERLLMDGLRCGASKLAGGSRASSSMSDMDLVLRDPQSRGLDVRVQGILTGLS